MGFGELVRRCRTKIVERYSSGWHVTAERRLEREFDHFRGTKIGEGLAGPAYVIPEREARTGAIWLEGAFAGSVIAYLTDLTPVDPIAFHLPEEPVLAAERVEVAGCPE